MTLTRSKVYDGAMPEFIDYDEFAYFAENAAEVGLPYSGPPAVRRVFADVGDGRELSALVWGDGPAEFVLLHGGAQNAHTWDTVALALDRPLVAIDLPGHGHSAPGPDGRRDSISLAPDIAEAVRVLAPSAKVVVGMSLGGLTTLALADHAPELVRAVVLVDITPGVNRDKSKAISDFVNGPKVFDDFDAILARTIEHNPTRSESSLRRGILHNAKQLPDGRWVWRYRRFDGPRFQVDSQVLWDAVSALRVPMMLVRGMRPQSVVDDLDEAELLRRCPTAKVVHVEEAGHSVQGDAPLTLARLLAEFVD